MAASYRFRGATSGLAVRFEGAEHTKRALAGLPAAVQRKVLRFAVAAAARPVASAVRQNLKAGSAASRRHEGVGAAARSVAVKVATSRRDPAVAYALIGARRGYSEMVTLKDTGKDREQVESITARRVTKVGKKGARVTRITDTKLKYLGKIGRKSRLSRRSNSSLKRVPSRYLHLLEKGANNVRSGKRWAGWHALSNAASATASAARSAFTRVMDAGISREFQRLARRAG